MEWFWPSCWACSGWSRHSSRCTGSGACAASCASCRRDWTRLSELASRTTPTAPRLDPCRPRRRRRRSAPAVARDRRPCPRRSSLGASRAATRVARPSELAPSTGRSRAPRGPDRECLAPERRCGGAAAGRVLLHPVGIQHGSLRPRRCSSPRASASGSPPPGGAIGSRAVLPRLGHTFIGVGLGVVYLSLYLGHFTLHVLSLPVAFGVAVAGVVPRHRRRASLPRPGDRGDRCRGSVPAAVARGVDPAQGFLARARRAARLPRARRCAGVRARRARGLERSRPHRARAHRAHLAADLSRRERGAGASRSRSRRCSPGSGSRHCRDSRARDGRVRSLDLAVIAAAPVGLVAEPVGVAAEHAAHSRGGAAAHARAALQLLAAWWVDSRRSERDLWRPLTGAAIVFFTAGLQRLVGDENLAMVWCVEGVVLVVLGMTPRGGWLRLWGHAVTGMAVMVVLTSSAVGRVLVGELPLVHLDALRELAVIVTLLVGATLLARGRAAPRPDRTPVAGTLDRGRERACCSAGAGASAMCWRTRVEGPGGSWWRADSRTRADERPATHRVVPRRCSGWHGSRRPPRSRGWGAAPGAASCDSAPTSFQPALAARRSRARCFPDGWSSDRLAGVPPRRPVRARQRGARGRDRVADRPTARTVPAAWSATRPRCARPGC